MRQAVEAHVKIVGACLARTATNSLKLALERLLGQPCYHMWELIARPEHFPVWTRAATGEHPEDWDTLLGDFAAGVDEPIAHFWRPLSAAYPDAKILLSARDVESWWTSCTNTVIPSVQGLGEGPMREMFDYIWTPRFGWDRYSERTAKAGYEAYLDDVRRSVPSGRLIEWHPGDGWGPICEGLELPVPDEPFPHVNTTAEYQRAFPASLESASRRIL